MHLNELKEKKITDLVELGKELGIENSGGLRRQDLIFLDAAFQEDSPAELAPAVAVQQSHWTSQTGDSIHASRIKSRRINVCTNHTHRVVVEPFVRTLRSTAFQESGDFGDK